MSPASSRYSPRSKRLSFQRGTSLILRRIVPQRNARQGIIIPSNPKLATIVGCNGGISICSMSAMNAKIASMTVGPAVGASSDVSVGSTITFNPHVMTESLEVLTERA